MRRLHVILWLLLCAATAVTGRPPAMADPGGPRAAIVIVVARSSGIDDLSLDELRSIFMLKSGSRLRPLNLPPGAPERIAFERVVLGMTADQAARYWIERKIRGQGAPPKTIPTAQLLMRIVARVPDTIGYAADGPLPPGLKVVKIGGRSPSDRGYPLSVARSAR